MSGIPKLIKCGDHSLAPWSLICVHLMEKPKETIWVPHPNDVDNGVEFDFLCPECHNRYFGEATDGAAPVEYLRPVCMHCVRALRQKAGFDQKEPVTSHLRDIDHNRLLEVMKQLDLDPENEIHLRRVRDRLRYAVPLCCVAFDAHISSLFSAYLPDPEKAWKMLDEKDDFKVEIGLAVTRWEDYDFWTFKAMRDSGFSQGYIPCPACTLTKNFVHVPPGCPCCRDNEEHPDSAGPSLE